jgi:hypothetical protein
MNHARSRRSIRSERRAIERHFEEIERVSYRDESAEIGSVDRDLRRHHAHSDLTPARHEHDPDAGHPSRSTSDVVKQLFVDRHLSKRDLYVGPFDELVSCCHVPSPKAMAVAASRVDAHAKSDGPLVSETSVSPDEELHASTDAA